MIIRSPSKNQVSFYGKHSPRWDSKAMTHGGWRGRTPARSCQGPSPSRGRLRRARRWGQGGPWCPVPAARRSGKLRGQRGWQRRGRGPRSPREGEPRTAPPAAGSRGGRGGGGGHKVSASAAAPCSAERAPLRPAGPPPNPPGPGPTPLATRGHPTRRYGGLRRPPGSPRARRFSGEGRAALESARRPRAPLCPAAPGLHARPSPPSRALGSRLLPRAPRSSRRRPPRGRRCPRASRALSAWPGARRPRSPQVPPPPPPQTVMEMSRCVWRGARETRQSCLPFPRGFPSLALLDAPGARGNLTSALPASLRSASSQGAAPPPALPPPPLRLRPRGRAGCSRQQPGPHARSPPGAGAAVREAFTATCPDVLSIF